MSWRTETIHANGLAINVTRTGGDKPPVLLLHGFTDFGGNWRTFARLLADRYELIMPDFRSHGASDHAADYGVDELAADAAGTLRALGISRAILMGHSMGAVTALHTAATYSGLTSCVILEDPPFWDKHEARAYTDTPWEQKIRAIQAMTDAERIAHGRAENPNWTIEEADLWSDAKVGFDIAGFRAPIFLGWPDWRANCRAMNAANMPGLLLLGETTRGAIVTPEIAVGMHALWPQLQTIMIPDAGHNVRRDNLPAYAEAVGRYLAAVG
jgi:N-formylmaleamate deformylase